VAAPSGAKWPSNLGFINTGTWTLETGLAPMPAA